MSKCNNCIKYASFNKKIKCTNRVYLLYFQWIVSQVLSECKQTQSVICSSQSTGALQSHLFSCANSPVTVQHYIQYNSKEVEQFLGLE